GRARPRGRQFLGRPAPSRCRSVPHPAIGHNLWSPIGARIALSPIVKSLPRLFADLRREVGRATLLRRSLVKRSRVCWAVTRAGVGLILLSALVVRIPLAHAMHPIGPGSLASTTQRMRTVWYFTSRLFWQIVARIDRLACCLI